MWFRNSLPLLAVTVLSVALAVTLPAQQVPNPVLPGPSGTGDGLLTRDALDAPETPKPAPTNPVPASHATARRNSAQRQTATEGKKRATTYATISHRHHRHRGKPRADTVVAANGGTIPARKPARQRAPLVSFIYWWNGWVVRTFHTRSGTVLLDTVGAKT